MKSRNSKINSSDDSIDTDTTDDKAEMKKFEPTFWDFLPYFNVLPYILVLFGSWYLLNHNTMVVIWSFYVLIPIIDILLPVDEKNLSLKQTKLFEKDKRFLLPLYIYMALDFAAFIWALYISF